MKNARLIFGTGIIITVLMLSAFRNAGPGTMKGTVMPTEGGLRAVAVSSMDTSVSVIDKGIFTITGLKEGRYNLTIETRPPYKPATIPDIMVRENEVVDVGIIHLDEKSQ